LIKIGVDEMKLNLIHIEGIERDLSDNNFYEMDKEI
jgi:hypothetical protein